MPDAGAGRKHQIAPATSCEAQRLNAVRPVKELAGARRRRSQAIMDRIASHYMSLHVSLCMAIPGMERQRHPTGHWLGRSLWRGAAKPARGVIPEDSGRARCTLKQRVMSHFLKLGLNSSLAGGQLWLGGPGTAVAAPLKRTRL